MAGSTRKLDGSLQLFASNIDDREGGGDAIKSERARASTALRETGKKFASKFRRAAYGARAGVVVADGGRVHPP